MDQKVQSENKAYEPPRAMRLGEMKSGAGDCSSGSGDFDCYGYGSSALDCIGPGNGAIE